MNDFKLEAKGNEVFFNNKKVKTSIEFFSGNKYNCKYKNLYIFNEIFYKGVMEVKDKNGICRLIDNWEVKNNMIQLSREIYVTHVHEGNRDGVWTNLIVPLNGSGLDYFIPAGCYKECPGERPNKGVILMEERLTYPLVLAYDKSIRRGLLLIRVEPAVWSETPKRKIGEQYFLHATDLGGVGYKRTSDKIDNALIVCLPYEESPTSRALNKNLKPIKAFLPLDCGKIIKVIYQFKIIDVNNFDDACLEAFDYAFSIHKPKPVSLPFTLTEAINYRLKRLAELYREWNGYAGFSLNFDPKVGVNSKPSGFERSFNELEHDIYPRVLEYGFTGRQLNNAYMLIFMGRKFNYLKWIERGLKVINSYIDKCCLDNGFFYTLFDVKERKPFQPIGDGLGYLLHYGVKNAVSGNYLRNMCEAAYDLLLCSKLTSNDIWLNKVFKFGKFLTKIQNKDGSWYRAYATDGEPITEPKEWLGRTPIEQKTATSVPIFLLVKLHKLFPKENFLSTAEKAGVWVLHEMVDKTHYRGGSLDCANVIDKEAMGIVLNSLMALYEQTGKKEYLKGAKKAGVLALTWNFLWDVPFEPGSFLYEYNFHTRGWGGIDIIWAGSVVDIYSLNFCRDWIKLSNITGNTLFKEVSKLVLNGTQQLLSYNENYYGMVETGMQEEGFAISSIGLDSGGFKKGDTWGGLGWTYAIGTFSVWRALQELIKVKE